MIARLKTEASNDVASAVVTRVPLLCYFSCFGHMSLLEAALSIVEYLGASQASTD
jgi:hypothetical protein